MAKWLSDRMRTLGNILRFKWARRLGFVWLAIGIWGDFKGEILPPEWATKLPRIYSVLAVIGDGLPLWAWIVGFALIFAVAALEYAHRRDIPAPLITAKKTNSRIPITEFLKMAELAGWDNETQETDFLALARHLRQAAVDGEITFYGRLYKYDNISITNVSEMPIVLIPASHFTEFEFDPLELGGQTDNYEIFTGRSRSLMVLFVAEYIAIYT